MSFFGRDQPRDTLQVENPAYVTGEGEPVAGLQQLRWRDGRQAPAAAFQLDQKDTVEMAKSALVDRLTNERTLGANQHLHGELATILVNILTRAPTIWQQSRAGEYKKSKPGSRDRQPNKTDLEETQRGRPRGLEQARHHQIG